MSSWRLRLTFLKFINHLHFSIWIDFKYERTVILPFSIAFTLHPVPYCFSWHLGGISSSPWAAWKSLVCEEKVWHVQWAWSTWDRAHDIIWDNPCGAPSSGTSSCPQMQGQPSWSCLRCVCELLTHNQGIRNPATAALQHRIREAQSAWVGRDLIIIQHPHSAPSTAASHSSQPPSFVLPHLPGTFLAEKLNSGGKKAF